MVRELLITQKFFSDKMVLGQGLFIISDEWLAFGHRSKISKKKKKKTLQKNPGHFQIYIFGPFFFEAMKSGDLPLWNVQHKVYVTFV